MLCSRYLHAVQCTCSKCCTRFTPCTHAVHAVNMLSTRHEHTVNMLWTRWELAVNTLWTCCGHAMNTLWTLCEPSVNTLWTLSKFSLRMPNPWLVDGPAGGWLPTGHRVWGRLGDTLDTLPICIGWRGKFLIQSRSGSDEIEGSFYDMFLLQRDEIICFL
jgi:hypothetical protein